ncbi:MAG TPA: DUF1801 domain-containing protein [Chitinophagaceae bacterium]|nr:DUF1801 domain-containing protein [Chitinophagaceae bacterium]
MPVQKKRPSPYGPVKFETIDQYHAHFPANVQQALDSIRKAIRQAAPKATEVISYNMPAFKQNKNLVYYAANKAHIGFYPTPSPIKAFKEDLEKYHTSKGAIQFPLDRPMPLALVKKMVRFRIAEDREAQKSREKISRQS